MAMPRVREEIAEAGSLDPNIDNLAGRYMKTSVEGKDKEGTLSVGPFTQRPIGVNGCFLMWGRPHPGRHYSWLTPRYQRIPIDGLRNSVIANTYYACSHLHPPIHLAI